MLKKVTLTLLAYIGALAVVVVCAFAVVIVLAGPHSGLLPHYLEPVVLGLGWLAVLVLPVLVARKVWRRVGSGTPTGQER